MVSSFFIFRNAFLIFFYLGEGAFSQVFKVKRLSDGNEYALKKVRDYKKLKFGLF